MRWNALGKVRRALQAVDILITRRRNRQPYFVPPPPDAERDAWQAYLQRLHGDPGDSEYREAHRERLARTMTLVPAPRSTSRALELGCYMHITPALHFRLGYREVRGAYLGPSGHTQTKTVVADGQEFRCPVDLFDAERDLFPYPDNWFDCVLACEIIEHLRRDPMHLLLEARRVLAAGGTLIVTTPNCASLSSVVRVLHGDANPQIFACYPDPRKSTGDNPHVREYAPAELARLLGAAGFRVEKLFTDRIGGYEEGTWAHDLLERNGFDTRLRGEQIYCRAIADAALPVERYPSFLYDV